MKLRDYLNLTGERPYKFAQRAGVRYAVVYALRDNRPIQMLKTTMQKIVAATDNAVRLEDLI